MDAEGVSGWSMGPDFIAPRGGRFDSALVEGGPQALRLSDGNLFYVYNSDEPGPSTPKPSWATKYNCGFLVLNGSNPTQILQRSDSPILSPELAWEVGTGSDGHATLTPEVVFCEGLVPLPGGGPDEFLMVYGAADSYVGVARVRVSVPASPWGVAVQRLSGATPAISPSSSAFSYSYSPGMYTAPDGSVHLLPRVRDVTQPSKPFDVTPSSIADVALIGAPYWNATRAVTPASVVLAPSGELPQQRCGVEDARVSRSPVDGLYHMFVNEYDCSSAHIAEYTAADPSTGPWARVGEVFQADPAIGWSKAGAPLYRATPPHLLLWGDNSDGRGIQVAISLDGATWLATDDMLVLTRPDAAGPGRTAFDSSDVEMGAPPVVLPDGNLLALYAGARNGVKSSRPDWDARYCVGALILNGSNPMQVLQRSLPEAPLLCPELPWETADGPPQPQGQYPNRVVVNGLVPLPGAVDGLTFLAAYGAGDAFSATALIRVTLPAAAA